jgi:hypothetical protein
MASTAAPTAFIGSVIIAAVVFTVAVAKFATAQLEQISSIDKRRLILVIVLMTD